MPVPRTDAAVRRPPGARRADLLALLGARGSAMTVAEIAPELGLHPNTVRAHLDVLVRAGRVTRRTEARATPGRPRELYEATDVPDDERSYALLAQVLASGLADLAGGRGRAVDVALAAGRRWAGAIGPEQVAERAAEAEAEAAAAVGRADVTSPLRPGGPGAPAPTTDDDASPVEAALAPVLRMLARTGFAPRLSPDGDEIHLRHCPFREVAEAQPDVVCSVHLGLIQGALERSGAPVAATRIVPFLQPDLCVTHLRPPVSPLPR
ncbi:ArsR family transcriptional regulator [Actinotalea ferrariae CF5-4]|uniref:ArsR family transcriptional regulator n=1 Tax=Actinotalea ferrariae CF5-4 TaxID=948458 RepID=A0A021VQ49_9CELL|nr:helix-turn-helix domain-containing protein [Actinotalea ferrariae]EYR63299.1 ArsR family transcriptional regulator [Actinotalea ferrariae CF5-4]